MPLVGRTISHILFVFGSTTWTQKIDTCNELKVTPKSFILKLFFIYICLVILPSVWSFEDAVDPWYWRVCGSKETVVEENLWMLGMQRFSTVLRCLAHFSHNATQLPLKTCCLSTHLKFSVDHFNYAHSLSPCSLSTICFLGNRFSQNWGQRNTQQITQWFKHNWP
jgi:hypothetical protein